MGASLLELNPGDLTVDESSELASRLVAIDCRSLGANGFARVICNAEATGTGAGQLDFALHHAVELNADDVTAVQYDDSWEVDSTTTTITDSGTCPTRIMTIDQPGVYMLVITATGLSFQPAITVERYKST